MPLSEDEQRILREIESKLYESDPALAREVSSTTIYSHAFRNIKWAASGLAVGMIVMIVALSTHWALAFGGFLIMLGCALTVERNARKMGRAGWQQLSTTMNGSGVRSYFGATGQRMRDRFQRDGD